MLKIATIYFFLQCFIYAQNYIIIQNGNSLFIPKESEFCTNYIIVEENAIYSTEDSNGTCSNAIVSGDGVIILPVELISFTAELNDRNSVLLKWETATEINNFGFEIERSNNNKSVFIKVGFVKGYGSSNSHKLYSFIDKIPQIYNKFFYRLKQINTDGSVKLSNIIDINLTLKEKTSLSQNFPNPFNPITKIIFFIQETGFVSVKIYNLLGEEVATLINENLNAGNYNVEWNAENFKSGIYFYEIKTAGFQQTKKIILMK
jgi:hypothetical protein